VGEAGPHVRQLRRARGSQGLLNVLPRRRCQSPVLPRGLPAAAPAEREGPTHGVLPQDDDELITTHLHGYTQRDDGGGKIRYRGRACQLITTR
jgi:hypothetical protein